MVDVTYDELVAYTHTTNELYKRLEEKFLEYAEIMGIANPRDYGVHSADSHGILFGWYETWCYDGGDEHHLVNMPTKFMFDRVAWQIEHDQSVLNKARLEYDASQRLAQFEIEEVMRLARKHGLELRE